MQSKLRVVSKSISASQCCSCGSLIILDLHLYVSSEYLKVQWVKNQDCQVACSICFYELYNVFYLVTVVCILDNLQYWVNILMNVVRYKRGQTSYRLIIDKLQTSYRQIVDKSQTYCGQIIDKLQTSYRKIIDKLQTNCRQIIDKLYIPYNVLYQYKTMFSKYTLSSNHTS